MDPRSASASCSFTVLKDSPEGLKLHTRPCPFILTYKPSTTLWTFSPDDLSYQSAFFLTILFDALILFYNSDISFGVTFLDEISQSCQILQPMFNVTLYLTMDFQVCLTDSAVCIARNFNSCGLAAHTMRSEDLSLKEGRRTQKGTVKISLSHNEMVVWRPLGWTPS